MRKCISNRLLLDITVTCFTILLLDSSCISLVLYFSYNSYFHKLILLILLLSCSFCFSSNMCLFTPINDYLNSIYHECRYKHIRVYNNLVRNHGKCPAETFGENKIWSSKLLISLEIKTSLMNVHYTHLRLMIYRSYPLSHDWAVLE